MTPLDILGSSALQKILDKLFHHRWIGILAYTLFLLPLALILLPLAGFDGLLPDNFSYRSDSLWEILLGLVLTAALMVYFAASIIRAVSKRQFGWVTFMVLFFPLTLFYLLFANTDRAGQYP